MLLPSRRFQSRWAVIDTDVVYSKTWHLRITLCDSTDETPGAEPAILSSTLVQRSRINPVCESSQIRNDKSGYGKCSMLPGCKPELNELPIFAQVTRTSGQAELSRHLYL